MTRPSSSIGRRAGALLIALAALALAAPTVAGASPTTYSTQRVSGYEGDVACLTPHRCVIGGYNGKGVADVVVVNHGVPGHVSVLPGSQGVYGISCPNSSGCVAIVRAPNDVGTELVDINAAGATGHVFRYSNPVGAVLFHLSCTSLKNCTLAGNNINKTPNGIEVATWNGAKLSFHVIPGLAKTTDTIIEGISCIGATCDVVGYFNRGATNVGISVLVRGAAYKLHTVAADLLYGVSCISQARCYADGLVTSGGVFVSLTNGALTQATYVHAVNLYGVACEGASCVGVGQENAQPPSADIYWGAVVNVTSGKAAPTIAVTQATILTDVASLGATVTLVGDAQKAGSIVAVG